MRWDLGRFVGCTTSVLLATAGCGSRPGGPAADQPLPPAPVVAPAPPDGRATGELAIGRDAGLLAYDPARDVAFVVDRRGDRVVVVDARRVEELASWPTPPEPYGIALTLDRAVVPVTTIADRTLVAFDARTGVEQWRAALAAEPRGVSVSGDGRRALVSSIATGALDHVALAPP